MTKATIQIDTTEAHTAPATSRVLKDCHERPAIQCSPRVSLLLCLRATSDRHQLALDGPQNSVVPASPGVHPAPARNKAITITEKWSERFSLPARVASPSLARENHKTRTEYAVFIKSGRHRRMDAGARPARGPASCVHPVTGTARAACGPSAPVRSPARKPPCASPRPSPAPHPKPRQKPRA